MLKISKPNKKTGIESFNIHNSVCKNIKGCKAQGCLKHCYYNKIIRLYPQQKDFLNNNLSATKRKDFVDNMQKELNKLNCRYFRIHTCGEFYNQEYFNKWVQIAQNNPDVIFFTYTKNINLDVTRPKNFILYVSDDLNIWSEHYTKFDGVSRIKEKNEPLPKGFSLCTNQINKNIKCIECKKCIKGVNICFNRH